MLISDQAKFFVKNCFEGGGCFHATIYIEKARVLRSIFDKCFARVKRGNIRSASQKCCVAAKVMIY